VPNTKALNEEVRDLLDLLDVARLVVSTLEMDQVLEAILKSAMKLTGTSAGSIALYHKETRELEIRAHHGFSQGFVGDARWKVRQGGLTDKILKSKQPTVISNTTNKAFFSNPLAIKEGIKSMACVPLVFNEDIIGVFYVDDFTPRKFAKRELRLLYILSTFAAMSIDHARLHDSTKKMAVTDGLTGLYNHRHLQEVLEKEVSRGCRYNAPFSLIMLDIDDFKRVNDGFGHPFGDRVLKKLADVLRSVIRDSDIAARYGGEEFAVILPSVDSVQAAAMSQRIMAEVNKKMKGLMKGKQPLTVSVGVSSFPADARGRMELIEKADMALYEAKRLGKDRVVQYRELSRSNVA